MSKKTNRQAGKKREAGGNRSFSDRDEAETLSKLTQKVERKGEKELKPCMRESGNRHKPTTPRYLY